MAKPIAKPIVPIFAPKLSCDSELPTYREYCRLALVRYKPWVGNSQSVAYGRADASDVEVAKTWESFLIECDVDNVPDAIHRQIRKYRAQKRREISNNDGGGGCPRR
mmetsp:Transcript_27008/g.49138  ORF Transcript_27008/g.49138 Transcript_27008/m.49138 type:complete len:107 (-) Transcript_27008:1092-1412(-)